MADRLSCQKNISLTLITDHRCKKYLPKDLLYKTIILKSYRFSANPIYLLSFLFSTFFYVIKICNFIIHNKTEEVISFGGYTSLYGNFAAILLGKKLTLHEQNIIAGRSNLFFANHAKEIIYNFPIEDNLVISKLAKYKEKLIYKKPEIKKEFILAKSKNYTNEKINILGIGGSQGAKYISEIIIKSLLLLDEKTQTKIKLSLQVRQEYKELLKEKLEGSNIEFEISDYFNDLAIRMAKSDLIISRSGASSIAEIAFLEKPSILIPYPYAKDNHQFHNANYLKRKDATIVLEETTLTDKILGKYIIDYIFGKALKEKITQNLRKLH